MRTLQHFCRIFDDRNDHVGPQFLARAIHVARYGPEKISEPTPDDLRPIITDLPEATPTDEAVRLLASAALRAAANSEGPAPVLRTVREALGWTRAEMGERLGLETTEDNRGTARCYTYEDWEKGKHAPDWRGRQKITALADELEI